MLQPVAKAAMVIDFDDGERIALQEDPVLERPRLGLVGVADQVVGLGRLRRHRRPFSPRRERRAAATDQSRVGDLLR